MYSLGGGAAGLWRVCTLMRVLLVVGLLPRQASWEFDMNTCLTKALPLIFRPFFQGESDCPYSQAVAARKSVW